MCYICLSGFLVCFCSFDRILRSRPSLSSSTSSRSKRLLWCASTGHSAWCNHDCRGSSTKQRWVSYMSCESRTSRHVAEHSSRGWEGFSYDVVCSATIVLRLTTYPWCRLPRKLAGTFLVASEIPTIPHVGIWLCCIMSYQSSRSACGVESTMTLVLTWIPLILKLSKYEESLRTSMRYTSWPRRDATQENCYTTKCDCTPTRLLPFDLVTYSVSYHILKDRTCIRFWIMCGICNIANQTWFNSSQLG